MKPRNKESLYTRKRHQATMRNTSIIYWQCNDFWNAELIIEFLNDFSIFYCFYVSRDKIIKKKQKKY